MTGAARVLATVEAHCRVLRLSTVAGQCER